MVDMMRHTKIPKPEWFSEPAFLSESAVTVPSVAFHSIGWLSENGNPHLTIGEFLFTRPDGERPVVSYLMIDDRDLTPRHLLITNMIQLTAEYLEGEPDA